MVTTLFLLLFFNWWYQAYYGNSLLARLYRIHNSFTKDAFLKSNSHIKESIHYSNYRYSYWDNFTKTFKNDQKVIDLFAPTNSHKEELLGEKCDIFFNHFNDVNPEFQFQNAFSDKDFYDKGIVQKENFFKDEILKLIKKRERESVPNPHVITKKDNKTINEQFYKRVEQTKSAGQLMADTITTLRIYGQCFINDHGKYNKQIKGTGDNKKHFDSLTEKFFFYFNGRLPVFDNLNGTKLTNAFPIYENNKLTQKYFEFDGANDNVIDFVHRHSNNRGIVISATTKYTRDIMKLIRVLRALNNELPIQIIYKGDLNQRSQKYIYAAARAEVDDLLSKKMSSDLTNVLPELDLLKQYKKYGSTFPKQDIVFVNIQPTMSRQHKYFFSGYTNKLLALLFTSFKEVLLFDADSVPLVKPEEFFASGQYRKSGALFFKDRSLRDTNDYVETNYFTSLMPLGGQDTIDTKFGIPPVSPKTLRNPYMTGWRHFQEAGVVAIDSYKHFLGILMTLPLALWNDPVKSSIWGDKEMYWLGLSMAGDENYEFNPYHAASIGEINDNPDSKYYLGTAAKEVCSSHPGHVNEIGKLLWINSGFSYCKKNGYFRDRGFFPFSQTDNIQLQRLYNNPLRIRDALVPPNLPFFRAPNSPPDDTDEIIFRKSWKNRKKDMDEINEHLNDEEKINQIKDWNPQKGWVKSAICSNYQYCGYNLIDSYAFESLTTKIDNSGKVFSFDRAAREKYDYLGKVWVTGNIKVALKSEEDEKKEAEKAKQQEQKDKDNSNKEEKGKENEKLKEEIGKPKEESKEKEVGKEKEEEKAKDENPGNEKLTAKGNEGNSDPASDPDEEGGISKQPSKPIKFDLSDLFNSKPQS